jgi:hypothetical protein
VNPVQETEEELRFARGGDAKLLLYSVASAVCAAALMNWGDPTGYLATTGLALLSVFLFGRFLKSDILTLNMLSRTFVRRRGVWPFLRITAGTFKDITGVELTTDWVRTRDDSPDRREWYVSLALPGEMTNPVLCVLSAYEPARAELVRYGNLLQVPVTDLGVVIQADPPAREKDSDLPDLDFDMD